ncbi:arylacetamide deacetylase-like isoform X2 [Acanthaster planci]|uniref:Arylacetamide deacetylase-like isoform X2 n=1 Tax=Acanthaster planci TaxID=133434 RepID=A0A8B7XTT9_ACAPL|nr:arylacetamide deacetylase-like isoform X2 [Acanthaster planci]
MRLTTLMDTTVAVVCLLVLICLLGLMWYHLYTPVPSAIKQKWTFRLVFIMFKVNRSVAWILTLFRVFGKTLEENMAGFTDWWLPDCAMDDKHVSTTLRDFDSVPVRIHRPKFPHEAGLLPALIYFHGGGFVYGSSASYHPFTRRLCESLQIVVVSVDYRLAPVHLFPAAYEDCVTATKWLLLNGPTINVDPHRIAVAGDSAGSQLTAGVVKKIHDDPLVPDPKLHALFNPALQFFNLSSPSHVLYDSVFNTRGGMLTCREAVSYLSTYLFGKSLECSAFIEWVVSNNVVTTEYRKQNPRYLSHVADELVPENLRAGLGVKPEKPNDPAMWAKYGHYFEDPRISPVMADNMEGLPMAYIATGNYDCLRDDGIFYARRLEEAGVPVRWVNYEDGFHGMLNIVFDFFDVSRRVEKDFVEFVRGYL